MHDTIKNCFRSYPETDLVIYSNVHRSFFARARTIQFFFPSSNHQFFLMWIVAYNI